MIDATQVTPEPAPDPRPELFVVVVASKNGSWRTSHLTIHGRDAATIAACVIPAEQRAVVFRLPPECETAPMTLPPEGHLLDSRGGLWKFDGQSGSLISGLDGILWTATMTPVKEPPHA